MKNPNPVNLQSSAEVRERGWQAESRDAAGHLISCHAPIEADDPGIAEWIVECTSRGETVTFWPTNGEVAATQPPPPSTHVLGHFKTGEDWIPVHRSTLERLGDVDLLKAALGSLSPNNLKTAGLTPEQVSAMESLYALAEAKDFFTEPPLVQPATAENRVERALALLRSVTPGNCERKNRHGFGDCGAEQIILDAIAVLQGQEPSA